MLLHRLMAFPLLILAAARLDNGCVHAGQSAGTTPRDPTEARPKLLSKEVFIRHRNGRPPVTGFVTYLHATKPILMHFSGWEGYSDGYDDYAVSLSQDNGKIWSKPEVRWSSSVVPEGRTRYAEPAASSLGGSGNR